MSRTQPNSLRTGLDGIRTRSVKARIGANPQAHVDDRETVAIIKRTQLAVGLSQKTMALNAGCPESELSEAFNRKPGRRFDANWLTHQDDVFWAKFIELLTEARKLTPEKISVLRRRRIVELVELLLTEVA